MKLIKKILCKVDIHWYIKIESYSLGFLNLDELNKYKCSNCGIYKYEDKQHTLHGYDGTSIIDLQDYNELKLCAKKIYPNRKDTINEILD